MASIRPEHPDSARLPEFERYNRVAIGFHWAIALLVLTNLPLGFFHNEVESATGSSPMWIHKSIGLTVLALSLARVAWRLTHRPPALAEHLPAWQALAARSTHVTLYALMMAVPLTGWLRSSAGPYPLTWFGLFDVPKFAIEKGSLAANLSVVAHDWLGWGMAALAGAHVAAALHHRFVLRDLTLAKMLP